jgi:DNA-binding transcriptional regulator GbsR (MarR family)
MCKPETTPDAALSVTPPMRQFIDYFGDLGPRWGVRAETSRAHALLFLSGRPMARDEIADGLGISKPKATSALKDLLDWDMAQKDEDGNWRTGGEPWDLMLAALDSRRQREIAPALEVLRQCASEAKSDPATPGAIRRRIAGVLTLVENLAAIDIQSRRLPKGVLPRLVGATGSASRLIGRVFPQTKTARR